MREGSQQTQQGGWRAELTVTPLFSAVFKRERRSNKRIRERPVSPSWSLTLCSHTEDMAPPRPRLHSTPLVKWISARSHLTCTTVSHSWRRQIIKVDLTWNVGHSHPLLFLHPLVSERATWQGAPSASISSPSSPADAPWAQSRLLLFFVRCICSASDDSSDYPQSLNNTPGIGEANAGQTQAH